MEDAAVDERQHGGAAAVDRPQTEHVIVVQQVRRGRQAVPLPEHVPGGRIEHGERPPREHRQAPGHRAAPDRRRRRRGIGLHDPHAQRHGGVPGDGGPRTSKPRGRAAGIGRRPQPAVAASREIDRRDGAAGAHEDHAAERRRPEARLVEHRNAEPSVVVHGHGVAEPPAEAIDEQEPPLLGIAGRRQPGHERVGHLIETDRHLPRPGFIGHGSLRGRAPHGDAAERPRGGGGRLCVVIGLEPAPQDGDRILGGGPLSLIAPAGEVDEEEIAPHRDRPRRVVILDRPIERRGQRGHEPFAGRHPGGQRAGHRGEPLQRPLRCRCGGQCGRQRRVDLGAERGVGPPPQAVEPAPQPPRLRHDAPWVTAIGDGVGRRVAAAPQQLPPGGPRFGEIAGVEAAIDHRTHGGVRRWRQAFRRQAVPPQRCRRSEITPQREGQRRGQGVWWRPLPAAPPHVAQPFEARPHLASLQQELGLPKRLRARWCRLPGGRLDPGLERRGLMKDVDRIHAQRDHFPPIGDEIAGDGAAAGRRPPLDGAVGQGDLHDLRNVERQEHAISRDDAPTTRPDPRLERSPPHRPAPVEGQRLHAVAGHDDHPAVDDPRHLEPIPPRRLPLEPAILEVEAVQFVGVARREQHATGRDDGRIVAPSGAFPAGLTIGQRRPAQPGGESSQAAVEGRRLIGLAHTAGVIVGPEEGPVRHVDGDHRTRSERTDEHAVAKRRRRPTESTTDCLAARDRMLLVQCRQRLRPDQAPIRRMEHVEPQLRSLLDEHIQSVSGHERRPGEP